MRVLPASMPSADLKWIAIVGPRSSTDCSAIQPPMRAAMIGISQTTWMVRLRRSWGTASGRSCMLAAPVVDGVPDEPRVEALGGEHGEHDHRAEGDGPGAR